MQTTATDYLGTLNAEQQKRQQEFDTWMQSRQVTQPAPPPTLVAEQTTGNALPSLSHAEEPATSTDTIAAPDLGGRWKTNFDFGATYTGNYRTGTPHRGVDMVPVQGGIGTEVSAFHPGTVSLIQRDRGAGGLMVYVQDDQGLTHAYMHLAGTAPGLQVGQRVARGTPIAQMGESGTEGSPHLHYEVRKSAASGDPLNALIDPRPYVAGQRKEAGAQPPPTTTATPQTTAGISGGGELSGRINQTGQQIMSGAAGIADWLGEQGQKALQAVLVTEGGLAGARGDNNKSAGPLQFFGEEGGRAGQLNAFAKALGVSLEQARQYAIDHPLEAIRWAIGVPSNPGYLGAAILDGLTKNLTGADLATHVQRIGQVSVSPERAAANWNNLFGQGQPVQRTIETGVGAARAGVEAALGGAVEQSGVVRRGAEDLVTSTQQTGERLRQEADAAKARFDQWQAEHQRNAAAFTAGTQRMVEGARAGLESFDPNVGLRQAGQMAQDFAATDLGQRVTSAPLPPLGGQSLGQMGTALQQAPENLATMGRGIQAGSVEAERQMRDPLLLQAARGGAGLAGQTLSPEIEEGFRSAARATPLGGALLDPGGVVSAMLKGGGMTTTVELPVLGDVPLADILGLASNLLIPTGAESRFGQGALRTGLTETSRLGRMPQQFDWAMGAEQGLGRAGRSVMDQATASRLAISAAGKWARASVEEIADDLSRGPIGDFLRNESGELDLEALGQAAQAVKQGVQRAYAGGPEAMATGPARAPGPEPMATDWDEVVDELSRAGELPGARGTPALRGAAAAAGQAIEPAREAPLMGGGTVGVTQSPTFLRESLRRMYPGAINKAAAKEATQNSVDASRGMPGAQTTVSVDNKAKTIEIVDQGKGMTPQVMEDVFVKLGGSSKPAGSSGGMGTAIKAIMANSEDTWVRTIGRDPATGAMTDSIMHGSGDDFLGGAMHRYYAPAGELPASELSGAPSAIQDLDLTSPNGTGTAIWVKPMADVPWDDWSLRNWMGSFNTTSRVPDQHVNFVVDGQPIPSDSKLDWRGQPVPIDAAEKPTQFLKTITVPGAEIDIYSSPGTAETSYAGLQLLNNGQYQADLSVRLPGTAKMPRTLVADVRATVSPKEVGYPWTADRNGLIDTAKRSVENYISDELAQDLIAQENTRVRESITKAPQIGMVKLVDDAELANSYAADTWAKVPKHPGYRRLANVVNDLHDNLLAELEGRDIPTPSGSGLVGPSHLIGLAASSKWLGLNVPNSYAPWAGSGDNAKGILIEPWKIWGEAYMVNPGAGREEQIDHFVDGLVATMIHEISHNTDIGGHDVGFAGLITRVPQYLGSRMHQAITKDLRKRVAAIWDTLSDDLANDAATFRDAARDAGLESYGIESGVARAGQPGLPETPGGAVPLPDQGGPGAGRRAGGPDVPPGSAAQGAAPQAGLGGEAMAAAPSAGPGGPLVVRSGGVRAAQAAQTLQQSLATIKPTRAQVAAATKDWLQLDRVGQRVSGLPPGVNTPRDLAAMRVHIDNLIQAGVAGKDWYINSAHKIRDAVGGDMQEAEKLAQLVGMMARNVNPDQNINYAIEAWNQWKSGIPVANVHRFGDVSREAADLLERGIPWEGRKTNSFYVNLMEELDPTLLAQKKATVDQWINRAYGYITKAPSNAQYNFMENEMRRIALARGERPSQVQAQMWVGQMALQAPNQQGAQDFSHALARRMGQVGIETDMPELGRAFLDDNGVDIVARAFGGLGGHSFEAPGGFQTQVAGALTPQTAPGGQGLRPASRATIEAIAAAKGHLLGLDNVGWTQVFPSTTAKDANAIDINAGRLLDAREVQDLRSALSTTLGDATAAAGEPAPFKVTPTERGVWLQNTSDLGNPQFRSAVDAALREVQYEGTWDAVPVRADSGRVTNDWSAQPNGEGFLEAIQRGGREEAFRSIQDSLGQRLAAARAGAAEPLAGAARAATELGTGAAGAVERGLSGAADIATELGRPRLADTGLAQGLRGALQPTDAEVLAAASPQARANAERLVGLTTDTPTEADIANALRASEIGQGAAGPQKVVGGAVSRAVSGGAPARASAQFAANLGGGVSGVAASEATMSEEDRANPWVRITRDLAFGGAGLAAPGVARGVANQAMGRTPSLDDLAQIRRTLGAKQMPLGPLPSQTMTPAQVISAVGKQNLLTGIPTHLANIASQLVEMGLMPARAAVSGRGDEAYIGLRAAVGSVPEALSQFRKTFSSGISTTATPGQQTQKWLPIFRFIGATDDFFRVMGGHMGSAMEAQHLVNEAGASTAADVQRILKANEGQIFKAGEKSGAASVFQAMGASGAQDMQTPFGRWKESLLGALPAGPGAVEWGKAGVKQGLGLVVDALVPFSGMPARLFDIGIGRLPGIGETRYAINLGRALAKGDKRAAQEALGDLGVQSIVSGVIVSNTLAGNVTGPENKEHPNSVKINGTWVDYSRWGAFQLPLAIPASTIEAVKLTGNKPDAKELDYMSAVGNAWFKTARNAFFLDGAFDLIERIGGGSGVGAVAQTATSYTDRLTPSFLNQVEQAMDANIRQVSKEFPRSVVERVASRIPYLAEMLPAQVEMTTGGARIRERQGPAGVLLGAETGQQPKVERELYRLRDQRGYRDLTVPREAPTTVSVGGTTIRLTEAEQHKLAAERGKLIDQMAGEFVRSPGYEKLTDNEKALTLKALMSRAEGRNEALWLAMTSSAEVERRMAAGRDVAGRRELAGVGR